jgi:hypothetical protein
MQSMNIYIFRTAKDARSSDIIGENRILAVGQEDVPHHPDEMHIKPHRKGQYNEP